MVRSIRGRLGTLSMLTSMDVANQFLESVNSEQSTTGTCKYLCNLSLLEYDLLHYSASEIAASALWLSFLMTRPTDWASKFETITGLTPASIASCIVEMHSALMRLPHSAEQWLSRQFHKDHTLAPLAFLDLLAAVDEPLCQVLVKAEVERAMGTRAKAWAI